MVTGIPSTSSGIFSVDDSTVNPVITAVPSSSTP